MSQIRSVLLLIIIPIITLLCSLAAFLVFAPFCSRKACDGLILFWARTLLWLSGVKVHVRGLENLDRLKSAIFVSNHLSHFDIPILYTSVPHSFRMAAKSELFNIPLFGRALRAFGFFPVQRETPENTKQTLKMMADRFNKGESVWMAPEGTRQMPPRIGEFKMGAFYLAIRTQQSVVPIVIYGSQYVLPKNSFLINFKNWTQDVSVEIGEPSPISQWPMEARHEFRDQVRNQMIEVFGRLAQG
jgi:1-acyl-sn-glycerol-3-phosphate acyltransferase